MPLLRKEQVADLIGVRPRTIDAWTQNGRLPVVKAGRLNRFRVSDIEKALGLPPGALSKEMRSAEAGRP